MNFNKFIDQFHFKGNFVFAWQVSTNFSESDRVGHAIFSKERNVLAFFCVL